MNHLLADTIKSKAGLAFILLICLITINGCTSGLKSTDGLKPVSEKENQLIDEGVKLHDNGDYTKAIEKYREALGMNPTNLVAMYEISLSYTAIRDCQQSLKYSLKGLEYDSPYYPGFAVSAGNCLDEMGESGKAIDLYKKAIKMKPDMYMLHFNLGVAYLRQEKYVEASECAKKSIPLNPAHASSHLLLANSYLGRGKTIPFLLAACSFLVLEPEGSRAKLMRSYIDGIYGKNLDKKDGVINLNIGKNDEVKAFTTMDMIMKINAAYQDVKKDSLNFTPVEKYADSFKSVFSMAQASPDDDKNNFFIKYYFKYYNELIAKDYVKPFTYWIFSDSGMEGVSSWLKEHKKEVDDFLEWSKNFQWDKAS